MQYQPNCFSDMRQFQKLLKQSVEVLNTRLFVVMAAHQNGWNFARQLQFLEDGIYGFLAISATLVFQIFHHI